MTVNITNVADTFGNEFKLCLYSFNPEVLAISNVAGNIRTPKVA